jgi:aminoglycoside phosphotransferase (APT) family kinase protein
MEEDCAVPAAPATRSGGAPTSTARTVAKPEHVDLLARLGVEAVEAFGPDPRRRTYRVRAGDELQVVKVYGEAPIGATAGRTHLDLLPLVADRCALVVPRCLATGVDPVAGPYVVLANIEGTELRTRWSHDRPGTAGGAAISPADVDATVDALVELASIAVDDGPDVGPDATDPRRWRIDRAVDELVIDGLITPDERDEAHRAIGPLVDPATADGPRAVTNGDFRFPNLIVLDDGRMALVDWDGAGASCSATERGVAHIWASLFERPDLRRRLVDRARDVLALDRRRFAGALAVHSARIAKSVAAVPERRRRAVDDLRAATVDARFEQIWG